MDFEVFKKKIRNAKKNNLLNESQANALLRKRKNIELEPAARTPLSMQDRNALRILRNVLTDNRENIKQLIIDLARRPLIHELLAEVDKGKVLCPVCRTGVLEKGSTSRWIEEENFHFILEHIPAEICSNPRCQETIFNSDTAKAESHIIEYVSEAVKKIQSLEPRKDPKQVICPLCEKQELEKGHTEAMYIAQQELFHLRIKMVAVQSYCPVCGYKEIGENVTKELVSLKETLTSLTFQLMNTT